MSSFSDQFLGGGGSSVIVSNTNNIGGANVSNPMTVDLDMYNNDIVNVNGLHITGLNGISMNDHAIGGVGTLSMGTAGLLTMNNRNITDVGGFTFNSAGYLNMNSTSLTNALLVDTNTLQADDINMSGSGGFDVANSHMTNVGVVSMGSSGLLDMNVKSIQHVGGIIMEPAGGDLEMNNNDVNNMTNLTMNGTGQLTTRGSKITQDANIASSGILGSAATYLKNTSRALDIYTTTTTPLNRVLSIWSDVSGVGTQTFTITADGTSIQNSDLIALGSGQFAGGAADNYLTVGDGAGINSGGAIMGISLQSSLSEHRHVAVGQDNTHNAYLKYVPDADVAMGHGEISCYNGNNNLIMMRDGGNVGIGYTSNSGIDKTLSVDGTFKVTGNKGFSGQTQALYFSASGHLTTPSQYVLNWPGLLDDYGYCMPQAGHIQTMTVVCSAVAHAAFYIRINGFSDPTFVAIGSRYTHQDDSISGITFAALDRIGVVAVPLDPDNDLYDPHVTLFVQFD